MKLDFRFTNLANLLTTARLIVIPFVCGFMAIDMHWTAWVALVLFTLAAVTDFFDGYIARHYDQVSTFGRVMDPIADKLLVGAVLLMLMETDRLNGINFIPALIILLREMAVSGLREYLAELRVSLPVTILAKWKTATQMTAIPFLIVNHVDLGFTMAGYIGVVLMWIAAALTAITGWDYWRASRDHIGDA